jgi:hypothetical protein
MPVSLSAPHEAERQEPTAADLARLYHELRQTHSDLALLPEFVRRLALLVENCARMPIAGD